MISLHPTLLRCQRPYLILVVAVDLGGYSVSHIHTHSFQLAYRIIDIVQRYLHVQAIVVDLVPMNPLYVLFITPIPIVNQLILYLQRYTQ